MTAETHLAVALGLMALQVLLGGLKPRALRDVLLTALGVAAAVALWALYARGLAMTSPPTLELAEPIPGARLAFSATPLNLFFAAAAASVSACVMWHATGIVPLTWAERRHAPPMRAMAAAAGAAAALALSATLFTMLLAATALALASAAAITRAGDETAARAAAGFLAASLCAAVGVLLPVIAWTHAVAGSADFALGGLLAAAPAGVLVAMLWLFTLGLVGPILPPLHRGLIGAAAADPPAAAIVFTVAAPAGLVGLLKVAAYVFGPTLADVDGRAAIVALAQAGAVFVSLLALAKDDLKQRLAYLCIAQLGLIAAGALSANAAGAFGAVLQLVSFAAAGAVLFMAAGAAEAVTGRRRVAEMVGLGRLMPFTFAAFSIAALAFAGVAPLAGAWSRLWLAAGAAQDGAAWVVVSVLLTGVLAFAALAPIALKALFGAPPSLTEFRPDAGSAALVAPIVAAAALLVGLVLAVEPLARALGPALQAAMTAGPAP